jgi:hypothetical protein
MTYDEKVLYHQIHPLKLFTDISTGFLTLYLMWKRKILLAFIIGFIPSFLVSEIIILEEDLEPYKRSRFGQYLKLYMTPVMEAIRLAGFGLACIGALVHKPWLILSGLLLILFGWLRGIILPGHSPTLPGIGGINER